jgi:L-glyceraldehyde 3-phosphate reductase
MFNRWIEAGLLDVLAEEKIGCIVFSPLAQGLLTGRYLDDIPEDSRAAKPRTYLRREDVTEEKRSKARQLNQVAQRRGQNLAQMAIAWVLRSPVVTSALIGASRPEQISEIAGALGNPAFTEEELVSIEAILAG